MNDQLKMSPELLKLIDAFDFREISKEEFLDRLPFDKANSNAIIRGFFQEIVATQNSDQVESFYSLLLVLEQDNEFTDLLNQLMIEPWHTRYEDIVHDLQSRKDPSSIPFIKQAMLSKYEYPESYGTGTPQLISQCGHALVRIGTPEALAVIEELSQSEDEEVREIMQYRLQKLR